MADNPKFEEGMCPWCGSASLMRSRRWHGFGEWLLGLVAVIYRCRKCNERSYRFRLRWKSPA